MKFGLIDSILDIGLVYQIAQSAVVYSLFVMLALLFADLGRLLAGGKRASRSQLAFLAFLGSVVGFAGVLVGRWEFAILGIVAGFLFARWFGGSLEGAVVADLAALTSIFGVFGGGVSFDPRMGFLSYLLTLLMSLILFVCSIGIGFIVLGKFKGYARTSVVVVGLLAAISTVLLSYYIVSSTVYRGLLPPSLLSGSLLGLLVLSCFGVAGLPTMFGLGVFAWMAPYIGLAVVMQGVWNLAVIMPLVGVAIVLLYGFRVFEKSRLYIGSLLTFCVAVVGFVDPVLLALIPFIAGIIVRGRVFVLLALLSISLAYSYIGWTIASYNDCLNVVGVRGWANPPVAAASAAVAHSYFLFYPSIVDPVFARSLALSLANVSGNVNVTLFSYIFGALMYLHNLTASKNLLPERVEVKGALKLPGTEDYGLPIFELRDSVRALLDSSLLPLCSPPAARLVRVDGGWIVDGVDYLVANVMYVDLQSVWKAVYGYLSSGALGNRSLQLLVYFALNNAYCDLLNQTANMNMTVGVEVHKMPFEIAVAYMAYALNSTTTCVEAEMRAYRLAGGVIVFALYTVLLPLLPLSSVAGRARIGKIM